MATLVIVPVIVVAALTLTVAPVDGGPCGPVAPVEPDGPAGPVVPLQAASSPVRSSRLMIPVRAYPWGTARVPFTKDMLDLPKRPADQEPSDLPSGSTQLVDFSEITRYSSPPSVRQRTEAASGCSIFMS
jgi:hypothetical protein